MKQSRIVEETSCSNSIDFSLLRSETSYSSSWFSDARSPLRKRTCLNKVENGEVFVARERTSESSSLEKETKLSSTSSRRSDRAINLEKEFLKLATSGDLQPSNSSRNLQEESKIGTDSEILNLGATSSNYEPVSESNGTSNGISNLSGRIEKLGRDVANIDRNVNVLAYQSEQRISGLSTLLKETSKECTVEKTTEVSGAREKEKKTSRDMAKMVLQRKCRSLSDKGVRVDSLRNRESTQGEVNLRVGEWDGDN